MAKAPTKKRATKKAPAKKRTYTQAPAAVDPGIKCVHCGRLNYKTEGRVTNTYPNGNRRVICESCGKPFVIMRAK